MKIRTRTVYRQGFRATFDADGYLLEADEGFPWGAVNEGEGDGAPMVQADIAPYQSQVTGEMITSRAQHREHLKRHGLVEIGNETRYLQPKKPGISSESRERRKRLLAQIVDDNLGYLRRGYR